jgi:hypothetical protein
VRKCSCPNLSSQRAFFSMGKEHKKPVAGTAGVGRKSHLLRGEGLRRRRPAEEGRASQPVQPRRPQLRRRLPAGRPQNGPALGLLNNWRAMEAAGGHTGPQNPTGEGAFDSDQLVEARRDRPDWGRFYYHRYWNNLPSRRSVQPTGPGPVLTPPAPPRGRPCVLGGSRAWFQASSHPGRPRSPPGLSEQLADQCQPAVRTLPG